MSRLEATVHGAGARPSRHEPGPRHTLGCHIPILSAVVTPDRKHGARGSGGARARPPHLACRHHSAQHRRAQLPGIRRWAPPRRLIDSDYARKRHTQPGDRVTPSGASARGGAFLETRQIVGGQLRPTSIPKAGPNRDHFSRSRRNASKLITEGEEIRTTLTSLAGIPARQARRLGRFSCPLPPAAPSRGVLSLSRIPRP